MIDIHYERKYHCDTNSSIIYRDGNVIAPYAVIHNMPNNIECFYIPFINEPDEDDDIFGYYISMYKPEYVIDTKNKLTKDMKESLMRILNNGGWKKLIEAFEEECGNNCSATTKECRHKFRKFPKDPPNYLLLPEN